MFDEVELSNESGNEWSDYDEKVRAVVVVDPVRAAKLTARLQAGTSVSIMEVETKIARA